MNKFLDIKFKDIVLRFKDRTVDADSSDDVYSDGLVFDVLREGNVVGTALYSDYYLGMTSLKINGKEKVRAAEYYDLDKKVRAALATKAYAIAMRRSVA